MAEMYPQTLLDSELKSKAEGRVFDALRDGLDDAWEAFHSVGWMTRDHAEGANDGEIDFVLAHPESAIICLEVKGGGLECSSRRVVPDQGRQARAVQRPVRAGARPPLRPASARSRSSTAGRRSDVLHRPRPRLPRHHRPQARARSRRAAEIVIDRNGLTDDRRSRSSACSPTTAARGTSAKLPRRGRPGRAARAPRARRPDRGADGDPVPRRGRGS